jgi:hypothetical protein
VLKFAIFLIAVCPMQATASSAALQSFPLAATVFETKARLSIQPTNPTALKREDYLTVISGIVDYFRHFQTNDGRIIDPFLRQEYQYSTPCYAWAAAALVIGAGRTNLLDSAALALDSALKELAENKAANNHGDFFTFPAMLSIEHLRDRVPPARRMQWEDCLSDIVPEKSYRDVLTSKHPTVHNWNIVALSGEYLRHKNGFTDLDFVERHLKQQLPNFTATGQYLDPNMPMAYDHFPRHFLAALLDRGYDGEYHSILEELLDRAAWTSLLIQSPRGELPTGGRSAQHQWNEAMQCVTYEVWAKRKAAQGDLVAARAFKRAAHLALQSVARWVRPSGELWIVKNHFDPAVRHGFEGYSSHSQYNLLAASMLATAWLLADDAIAEGACPADIGGFAIQLPEFHKIFANAGGLYLELDTGADPHYNSTGLIRVHKQGLESLVGPSDSSPIEKGPLAIGIAWREGDRWQPLAGLGKPDLKSASLRVIEATPGQVRFSVRYTVQRPGVRTVIESYDLTPEQVRVTAEIEGSASQLQVRFPAFVFDGMQPSQVHLDRAETTVRLNDSRQIFHVEVPGGVKLQRTGEWIPCRNGFLEPIEGVINGKRVVYTLKLQR